MSNADLGVLLATLGLTIWVGIRAGRHSRGSFNSFFLGGKSFGWGLAGVSMVATTFAVDTPLAVTEWIYESGISGNWKWWNFVMGGMLTALFFASMWYRSGVKTENELISIRYSGKKATLLRVIKSTYLGLFVNLIIMSWVNVAFITILQIYFDLKPEYATLSVFLMMGGIALYTFYTGLRGVVVADNVQFLIAMAGCIVLAIFAVNSQEIGGLSGLTSKLPEQTLAFLPTLSSSDGTWLSDSGITFLIFMSFIWWATWYPGNEPGGGGYVAQRLLSTKSERDAGLSVFLFQLLNIILRPWPWILVALCAVVLYPNAGREGYVLVMQSYLPSGFQGLMLAAFFSAYMSTISTHLNWGSSYLVNDVLPQIKSHVPDKQKVLIGRYIIVFFMIATALITPLIPSISGAWVFLMECGAGLGSVLLLRWFWWRINAWSEITATITPFIVKMGILLYDTYTGANTSVNISFFITFSITTIAWVGVTLKTPPEPPQTLQSFFNAVKPLVGWKTYRGNQKSATRKTIWLGITWLSSVIMSYALLFTIGSILLKPWYYSLILGFIASISALSFYYFGKKSSFI